MPAKWVLETYLGLPVAPSTVATPCAPCVTAVTVSGSLSASVSLARTAIVTGVPAGVDVLSLTATGGWLTVMLSVLEAPVWVV